MTEIPKSKIRSFAFDVLESLPLHNVKHLKETLSFCTSFLNPRWKGDYFPDSLINISLQIPRMIKMWAGSDVDAVARFIKAIPYDQFLETLFWKCVAADARERSGHRCEMCPDTFSNYMLHVHHKTYDHHGYEASARGLAIHDRASTKTKASRNGCLIGNV